MFAELIAKEKKVGVIGLGYVGLPIALEAAKHYSVIGFDINAERVVMMQNAQDPSHEIASSEFEGKDITFTSTIDDLKGAHFFIVAVPTPVDEHRVPNLTPLISASNIVGSVLKEGDYVVFESTVYPGCTEEECVPILEKVSRLEAIKDFKIGYSPERINPGDKKNTLTSVVKIVSGCDEDSLSNVSKIYSQLITAGVYEAASIKVAEAAKVIENTQRDVNIALMNELAIIFDRMNINTLEVIEAASSKWNFLKFYPGLVGGHCIGVDPYYLAYKSSELGYEPEVILSGRRVNDNIPIFIAKKIVKFISKKGYSVNEARVLVMGITFKENVCDIRNSKVVKLIEELKTYSIDVDVVDYFADSKEVKIEYGFPLQEKPEGKYNAIIVAVNHDKYKDLKEDYFLQYSTEKAMLVDVKSIYKNKINEMTYWAL